MKRLLSSCLAILGTCISMMSMTYAHDFDAESMQYILWLTWSTATWTEYETYMLENDKDAEFASIIDIPYWPTAIALSLPEKKLVLYKAQQKTDFSRDDVEERIGDDPMLQELWVGDIYTYLDLILRKGRTLDSPELPALEESIPTQEVSFRAYIKTGWDHIIWGYDHILFIFALLIALPSLWHILKVITTFTLAHSLTILLWSLWRVTIPSVFVETVIAWSIFLTWVYMRNRKIGSSWTWWQELIGVFLLWLIHGLWFSSFFIEVSGWVGDIILPILWFNLWVEMWQIVIIMIIRWLLSLVYNNTGRYRDTIKKALIVWLCLMSSYRVISMFI